MTERLYYTDSHLREFTAEVISCEPDGQKFRAVLSRTAFFPEGGGQKGDTGMLDGVPVLDTKEKDGVLFHVTASSLEPGTTVTGVLDWEKRFSRMQSHSGEHIVSGLAHKLYGCDNVGFHMSEPGVTLDFDRELTKEDIRNLEEKANRVIWDDREVRTFYPSAEMMETLVWRQKKPLSGDIRLVEIPGADLCACCAPHVYRTGEIGSIRIIDFMRHRGGMRLTMMAGRDAFRYTLRQGQDAAGLSRLLSAPKDALLPAAGKLAGELEKEKLRASGLERELCALVLEALPVTEGNLSLFVPADRSAAACQLLAEGGAEKCGGFCAVFSGSDAAGWNYTIISRHIDLKAEGKSIQAAISGRGGGSREMLRGRSTATEEKIRRALE